jgi:hypothetical protein
MAQELEEEGLSLPLECLFRVLMDLSGTPA